MGGVACERRSYTCGTRLEDQVGTGKGVLINMAIAGEAKNKTSGKWPRAAVVTTAEAAETEGGLGKPVAERKGPNHEEK